MQRQQIAAGNGAEDADAQLQRVVFEARSFAARHGLVMRPGGGANVRVVPYTLLPSPMSRDQFAEAFNLAHILTRLTTAVAQNEQFLRDMLCPAAAADPFLTRLLALLDLNRTDQRIHCTVNRYDFFVDASSDPEAPDSERGLRLVEINCTAAGVVKLSDTVSRLHRAIATHPAAVDAGIAVHPHKLPVNNAVDSVVNVLALAHKAFVAMHSLEFADVRAIMVVSPPYENIGKDTVRERLLEEHGFDMLRVPLCDIASAKVDADGLLRLATAAKAAPFIVSVAYIRCGYGPEDYVDERAWDARAALERSATVCVPPVAMQLAGTKKMLQALSNRGTLERFLPPADALHVEKCLVQQWALDGDDGEQIAHMAINNPDDYVLKPQRDGGGYNLFRDDIRKALEGASPDLRAQFVLQQRIHPRSVLNTVVREDGYEVAQVVRELGVFGAALAVDDVLVVNDARGHAIRSKKAGVDGGGVTTGIAFVDSPRLEKVAKNRDNYGRGNEGQLATKAGHDLKSLRLPVSILTIPPDSGVPNV